jgi:hypothetical protein
MTNNNDFFKKHPFLSCIKSNEIEYLGIIINYDNHVASIYDISKLKTIEEKGIFLDLGETWWWESNRKIPINIFLKNQMQVFRPIIKTFNSKDIELVFGPTVNLSEIAEKRIKRKSIQLIRTVRSLRI